MIEIQLGIMGLGGIGRQFLGEMQAHERFTVVAGWDPSETARAAAVVECPGLTIAENADRIFSNPSGYIAADA